MRINGKQLKSYAFSVVIKGWGLLLLWPVCYRQRLAWLGVLTIFLSHSAWAEMATMNVVQVTHVADLTRFSFELQGGSFHYKWKFSPATQQLTVDVDNAVMATILPPLPAAAWVQDYQVNHLAGSLALQLQFHLKTAPLIQIYVVSASAKQGARLIVDLKSASLKRGVDRQPSIANKLLAIPDQRTPLPPSHSIPLAPSQTTQSAPMVPPQRVAMPAATPAQQESVTAVSSVQGAQFSVPVVGENTHRPIMVVIDPGHGGKDSGAVGPHHVKEKDIALAISKVLQRVISQQPGFQAQLTRNHDVFISLRERQAIARRYKADIFIAIHADAALNNEAAAGASVFALSERGATSEMARWLAKNENASELLYGVTVNKDQMLRSVLLDLSQTHTIAVSLQMGEAILAKLSAVTKLHYARVEQAAFVVLKSLDIPSLLIETGYISNPAQEQKLKDPAYQLQLANAIVQGILSYFNRHPPSRNMRR